jgi:hypothetical protein
MGELVDKRHLGLIAAGCAARQVPQCDPAAGYTHCAARAAETWNNTYLGLRGSVAGGDVYGEGEIYFPAPLDPAAAFVDLMPTGPKHRAVIRVPMRRA